MQERERKKEKQKESQRAWLAPFARRFSSVRLTAIRPTVLSILSTFCTLWQLLPAPSSKLPNSWVILISVKPSFFGCLSREQLSSSSNSSRESWQGPLRHYAYTSTTTTATTSARCSRDNHEMRWGKKIRRKIEDMVNVMRCDLACLPVWACMLRALASTYQHTTTTP